MMLLLIVLFQAYIMNRPIRGRAVIINNKTFTDGRVRRGSEQDLDHVQELFGEFLQFQTKVYTDISSQVISLIIIRTVLLLRYH